MSGDVHPESQHSVHGNSAPVTQVTIDLGNTTMLMALTMAIIIGSCGVVIGVDIAERASMEREFAKLDRQYRMTELKLDDWTVVAHRAGLQLSGDYTRGPQGNLDTESFTQEKDYGSRRNRPSK